MRRRSAIGADSAGRLAPVRPLAAVTATLAALVLLLLPAPPVAAYFEESDVGARSIGFGRAFTAIADDASALHWNPAGLAWLPRAELELVHSRPYMVPELASNYAAFARPCGFATLGVSWHHNGVSGAISENMWTLGGGREVWSASSGFGAAVGGALKLGRVSFPGYPDPETLQEVNFESATRLTADLAVMVRFPNRMRVGYALQNIGSPEFDVLSGGGGTRLHARSRLGAAYQWNPESTVSVDWEEIEPGRSILNIGGEIWFYRAFAMRAGISDRDAGGGVSIKARRWLLDLAFLTNQPLGVSYRAGVRIPLDF